MAVAPEDLGVFGGTDEAALRVRPVLAFFLRQAGGRPAAMRLWKSIVGW